MANKQLHIKNAFLDGNVKEMVYMEQLPIFIHHLYLNHMCLLKKSLYNLKHAPHAWFEKLSQSLFSFGFHYSKNSSLFIYKTTYNIILFLVYVDSVLITRSSSFLIHQLMNKSGKEFSLKDLGKLNYFLGVEVKYFVGSQFLSQTK